MLYVGSKLDILADNYRIVYREMRRQPVRDQWPPNQPSTIVNVALIHHEGEQTRQELIDMSIRNVSTVEELSHHPRVTKRIADIFRSTHKRILIEGAPGIGKTVLAKEIAYCWANGQILIGMKLFLLVIRDPNLHCVDSISELVHYLNNDYLSDSEVELAVDKLRKSKGSGIVFVFDGYDECPSDSKLKDFVDKLVEGRYLPMCIIVITSRPTASLLLRYLVDQRIEVLGLAKKEQDQYILESLKGPELQIKLLKYLKQQPVINSLIYVPLHLAILLYLFKQNALPESLTEMNEYFIIHTIYRHLRKQRQLSYLKIEAITDLLEPEHTTLYQLAKLAYKGLCNNQLVFTYDEMKEVCSEIDESDINGFGLMQTVECYCQKGAGKSISLNFLHFTMQEYLAALHVSNLPRVEQSSLIEKLFWDRQFNYMWIMYIGIVGAQLTSFNKYIIFEPLDEQQNHKLHDGEYNILARKKLFLFQCCIEGKDVNLINKAIATIFSDGNINLSKVTLLPHHIMSLIAFMMRSTTQWKSLNLDSCSIGDNGMSNLAKFLNEFKERIITIKYINLRNNHLTSLFLTQNTAIDQDYTVVFGGLLQSVEELDVSFNLLCDREISFISDCVKINSTLSKLNLSNNKITDEATMKLAIAIQENTALEELNISGINLSDKGVKKLSVAIQVNTVLQKLNISSNKLHDEGAKILAIAIQVNVTIQQLDISKNWISKQGVMRMVEACTKNRTLHKLVCTHNNLSKSGLAAINEYIRKENAVQIFDASWNSLCSKSDILAFKTTFQLLDVQQKLQSHYGIQQEIWHVDKITEPKYLKEFMQNSLDDVHINVAGAVMTDYEMSIFCDCLMTNSTLMKLELSSNTITDETAKIIIKALQVNKFLQSLDISCNKISDKGLSSISDYIKTNNVLCKLNLSDLQISDEGAKTLAVAIEENKTLQEINISKNLVSKEGVMRIVEACTNRTLHKLVCTHNNLSKSGLAAINEYIRNENYAVQIFDASWNTLCSKDGTLAFTTTFQLLDVLQELQSYNDIQQEIWHVNKITEPKYLKEFMQNSLDDVHINVAGAVMTDYEMSIFCDCLMTNSTLMKLELSSNTITDETAKIIIKALQVNKFLQNLDISCNKISDKGLSSISDYIKTNNVLCKLNLSDLQISDEGAKTFAVAIEENKTLQELNISKNLISKEGVMRIVEACTKNRTLHKLVCTHNNLSKSGLAAINEYIRKENAVQIFDASWNTLCSKYDRLAFKTTFQLLDVQQKSQSHYGIQQEIWYVDEITEPKHFKELMQNSLDDVRINVARAVMTDYEMSIFCDRLMTNSTLMELELSSNKITDETAKIIIKALQVNKFLQTLDISCNKISDKGLSSISDYIKINNVLCKLNLSNLKITDEGTKTLAVAIQVNTALRELNISNNRITDEGAKTLALAIQVNTTLQDLNISNNRITDEGAKTLAVAIQVNTVLQELNISKNWISKEGVMRIVEACTKNRTLHKLVCTHNNLSKSGLAAINEYIRKENAVQIFDASWNTLCSKGDRLAFKITFQLLNLQQKSQSHYGIQQEIWHVDKITDPKYFKELMQNSLDDVHINVVGAVMTDYEMSIFCDCLMTNSTLMELELSSNKITDETAKIIIKALQVNKFLQTLDISCNKISDKGLSSISDYIKINNVLCKLNLSDLQISDKGAKTLAVAIQVNRALQELNISNNRITDEGAKTFAIAIEESKTLQELNISKNLVSKEGVMRIVEACTKNRTLHKLVCTHNNLSKSGLAAISEYIRKENAVQIFDASWNSLCSKGYKLAFKTTFQLLGVQQKSQSRDDIQQEIWHVDEITEPKYLKEFMQNSLDDVHINVAGAVMTDYEMSIFCDCLITNSTLMELDLSSNTPVPLIQFNYSNDERIEIIVKTLQVNKFLQTLDISGNFISDKGMSSISDYIKTNNVLYKLNLSNLKITDEEAKTLAAAIQVNTALQELNISKNWISEEGVMRVLEACTKHRTLHKLVCTHNNLSKSGLATINEYIKKENAVQIFDASWNTLCSKDGTLAFTTTFQLLDVPQKLHSHNDIQQEIWYVDKITDRKYVKEFMQNSLDDVQHIAINLADAVMTEYQISILCDCLMTNSTLMELNLSDNKITDERIEIILKALQVNKFLQSLDISCSKISDKGMSSISDYIRINNVLYKLNLSNLKITDEGTKTFAVAILLNTTLQKLNISNNRITDEGAKTFAVAIQVNTTLQELNISNNRITDEGAKTFAVAIQVNTTLQELNISKNWISEEGVMRIVKTCTINRTLHKLVCTHNNLSKSGLAAIDEYIRKENAVQIFDASWNSVIASSKCGSQLVITTLLSLRRSPDGWENSLLKEVWLVNNIVWTNISCRFTHLTLMQLEFPSNCIVLNTKVDVIQRIMQIDTLQKLSVSHNKLSDDGAIAFSKCLKTNTTLIELDIKGNNITYKGASRLAETIQVNTALQKLNMSFNQLSDDVAMAFSKCLKANTTLIELNMGNNNITYYGAISLAKTIEVNIALQKLNITNNQISDNGAIAFSECLKTNTTLIELNIGGNNITYKGASRLAEAIQVNTALQKLKISNNLISDDGAIAFSKCLKSNTTLIELDMWWNNITYWGARILAEAIQVNTALQKLNISSNPVSDDGAIAFSECLKTNTTLIELKLPYDISSSILKSIEEAVLVNRSNKHTKQ